MVGTDAPSLLIATREHDAGIRRLLRETPMAGEISLSMETEPSYFDAAGIAGEEHNTVVAVEEGRVIAMGSIGIRQRFINGRPMRVGYLSRLRLAPTHQGRAAILRQGYELLHQMQTAPICFTTIFADNHRARRFLERGVRGMPTYRLVGELVTLLMRAARRGPAILRRSESAIAELLNRHQREFQFAPDWSAQDLPVENYRVVCEGGSPVACAALWDQRSLRQLVVRGYSGMLARTRPIINLAARVLNRPRLPAIGETVANAFVSRIACDVDRGDLLVRVVRSMGGGDHEYLTLAMDSRDPRLAHLRKAFAAREYVSRVYTVSWDSQPDLDDRLIAPEAALL